MNAPAADSGRPTERQTRAEVAALRGRRVLVTGATGFIGGHVVRRLAGLGATTYTLSRKPGTASTGSATHLVDLGDPDSVAEVVHSVQPDFVFHLAGVASGSRETRVLLPTLTGNLQSTVNVLHAATLAGKPRVVLAGSMEEPTEGERASSPYAVSKWAGARYAELFHDLWSLPTVWLRIAMVYGPAQPDERKLIPYVVTSLLQGTEPGLTSGTRKIDWVYVDDVVDAFIAAASAPAAAGRTFEIGSGTGVNIRRTVELIQELIGADVTPHFDAFSDRPHDTARIADIRRARDELGWRPSVPLREGLRRTIDWYRDHLRNRGR